jgi:DNA recombination-dependent growth factor C
MDAPGPFLFPFRNSGIFCGSVLGAQTGFWAALRKSDNELKKEVTQTTLILQRKRSKTLPNQCSGILQKRIEL